MSLPKSTSGSVHEEDELCEYRNVFPDQASKLPYSKSKAAAIARNRGLLANRLFFDNLCEDHVDKVESITDTYPPKSTSSLRHLFEKIVHSNIDRLKQHSFVYYLMRDYGEEYARKYAQRALLPEHFCLLMDGIWLLDNFEFERALLCITHPSVTFPYPDKILTTLTTHAPTRPDLALAFIESTNPPILSDASTTLYFKSLLSVSPAQAFLYTRSCPPSARADLLKMLVEHCLTIRKSANSMMLLNLPMTKEEEAVCEEYIKRSPLPHARDALLVKYAYVGRLEEVLEAAGGGAVEGEEKAAGLNWGDLRSGVELGVGIRRGLTEL
ncbi:nuclear pore complex assembly-domain-containing protein [Kalaharituber pfeilii]|nr:nuclear pore complex assembly-domain-containing protein [Kalaharituber pfeilii]